ncbi:MAG: hypothetical protein ACLFTH_00290 [Candidatus Woesearchaeota archaeon]
MSFKGKESRVVLLADAKKLYLDLKQDVELEIKKGRFGTKKQKLFSSINRAIEKLKENPQYGIHIKKKQIPQRYIELFDVKNLWKVDLAGFWRLIYWIHGTDEIQIVSFVVDILDHKTYNKRFQYSNR